MAKHSDTVNSAAKPVRVLQVLPALKSGGVERGCLDLALGLKEKGIENFVTSAGGKLEITLKRWGVSHITLPLQTKNPVKIWLNSYRLMKLIQREHITVVHARSRAPAWSAYFACCRLGIPYVTTYHAAYTAKGLAKPFKRWYNKILAKGDQVIAISRYIWDHLQTIYPDVAPHLNLIYRGVDVDVFNPEKVSAERMIKLGREWNLTDPSLPVIMLPARMARVKGHEVLLKALTYLDDLSFYCVIVGGADKPAFAKHLQRLAKRYNLNKHLVFAGDCADMPAAYMLADVVVHPPIRPEAFGRVVAEAQAMGRPVVATTGGATAEVIEENKTGWLVPPQDAVSLARMIRQALNLTPEERQELAAHARERVVHSFNKKNLIEETVAVYHKALQGDIPKPVRSKPRPAKKVKKR